MAGRNAFSQLLRVRGWSVGLQTVPRAASRAFSGQAQGEDIVKQAFSTQQSKFRSFISELSKAKVSLNAEDPKAVTEYAKTMKGIRTKLQIPSYTEKLQGLLDLAGDDCSDVRSYLELQTQLRRETGIQDDLGADKLMIEAVDKVEKSLGKVLLLEDQKGLTLFAAELDAINKKLGLDEALLEKLEEEAEVAVAKGELDELAREAREKIETYKRRDELDAIAVDPKDLDFRPYL